MCGHGIWKQTCSTDWSGAKEMPKMGLMTLPKEMIWVTELRIMSTGTAKPTPLFAPEGEYIAVFIPAKIRQLTFLDHSDI